MPRHSVTTFSTLSFIGSGLIICAGKLSICLVKTGVFITGDTESGEKITGGDDSLIFFFLLFFVYDLSSDPSLYMLLSCES